MTNPEAQSPRTPRAFLSYSHSSVEYANRVLALAVELASHGVDLVFDQWDLREGQDLHAFMERAVTDQTVTHILILCDPRYSSRANDREGGVGAETLIISPSVYRDVQQSRVVPVLMERDGDENVVVPAYLDGRLFIDLSTPERASTGYEQLIRVLHGRPARSRPPLGEPPAFLNEGYVPLVTSGAARLARSALLADAPSSSGRFADYLHRLQTVISAEEINEPVSGEEELSARAHSSIAKLRAFVDEFIALLTDAARYAPSRLDVYDRLHGFFEALANVRIQHHVVRYDYAETEAVAFVTWELMLNAVATLMEEKQVSGLARLLEPFLVRSAYESNGLLRSAAVLEPGFVILSRNVPDQPRRWAEPAAMTLMERSDDSSVRWEAILEADLLLWYRTSLDDSPNGPWVPRTLASNRSHGTLPFFARLRAPGEFARWSSAVGVASRAEFIRRFHEITDDSLPPIGLRRHGRAWYAQLIGIDSN